MDHEGIRIKDAAALFDISRDTLLYYDRIGLISPGRKPNGYRCYTREELTMLDVILSLRDAEVPIDEIKRYFRNRSREKLEALSEKEILSIDRRIAELEERRKIFARLIDINRELEGIVTGRLYPREIPDGYFLYSSRSESGSLEYDEWYSVFSAFIKEHRGELFMHIGSLVSYDGGKPSLEKLYIESTEEYGELRPGGLFLFFYWMGSYESLDEAYCRMEEEMRKEGFRADGPFYEDYLVTSLCEKEKSRHITRLSVRAGSCE